MRIAIVDESAVRATIIEDGLAELDGCELFVLTERKGLLARIDDLAAFLRARSGPGPRRNENSEHTGDL